MFLRMTPQNGNFAMLPWKPVYLSLPRASLRKTALARQYFYAGKIQSSLWELEENYSVFTKFITLNTVTPFIQTLSIPRQCLCERGFIICKNSTKKFMQLITLLSPNSSFGSKDRHFCKVCPLK